MSGDDIDPAATPLTQWMDRLAEPHGSPGGGAACAVMTAVAAGLLGMVAAYTADDREAQRADGRLARIRREALTAAEEDGIRSADFGAALAMGESPDREDALREATVAAIASSLEVGRLAQALVDEVRLLADIGNPHVEADLWVAAQALLAALEGTAITARSNLDLLARHRSPEDGLDARVEGFQADIVELEKRRGDVVRTAVQDASSRLA